MADVVSTKAIKQSTTHSLQKLYYMALIEPGEFNISQNKPLWFERIYIFQEVGTWNYYFNHLGIEK